MYVAVTLVAVLVGPVAAMTPAVLVDSDLRSHRVNIQSLVEGLVSYFDSDRRLRVAPLNRYVQLRGVGEFRRDRFTNRLSDGDQRLGVIELVDGQRLIGQWIGADTDDETIVWRHRFLGDVAVSLDQISAVAPASGLTSRQIASLSSTDDRVELVNGDTLLGFVIGISTGGLEFQIQGQKQTVVLPVERVRSVIMADVPARDSGGYSTVWLADGSRVMTRSVQIEADQLSLDPVLTTDASAQPLPMAQVARIDLASDGGYLIDLADLPMRVADGGSVFGLTFAPVTAGASISMHAPVSVRYELPTGAARLSATAVLVTGSEPDSAAAWADFEVIVAVNKNIVSQSRLNTKQTTARINTLVSEGTLTIELDPADNGPVMDRLRLRNAVVFVRSLRSDAEQ